MPAPRVGDLVYVEGAAQPNGEITHLDYHDEEVYVLCYDTDERYTFSFETFDYFNERLNQWMVHKED